MEMADFFDTSVDVPLGYELHDHRIETTVRRLKRYRDEKDAAGLQEAEKALKQYPNVFEIAYNSAAIYRLFGMEAFLAERGEDYLCGENGKDLSGGEKQRISIARSVLKHASVLLADEATAALDAQTAYQVTNDILSLENMTRIVVTHALKESLLRRYDAILVMKNGEIVERGSFDALMAQDGYFRALYTVSQ